VNDTATNYTVDQAFAALEALKATKAKHDAISSRQRDGFIFCPDAQVSAAYAAAGRRLFEVADYLYAKLTGFKTLNECLDAQANGYRPTFREDGGRNRETVFLAEVYDLVAEARGLALRAYRPEQAKPLPAGLQPLPACIRDDKRGFYNSNGYASQIIQFIESGRIADAVLLAVRVAGNDHRHAADIRDWFSRTADSLKKRLDEDRPEVLTLQWIKDRCRQLRDIAHAEAKTVDCKFIRSRGFEYRLCSEDDVIECSGPGCKEPTLKGLRADAARCSEQGGNSINISGGYDGSDDFGFSDYQPFVTEWDLTLTVDEILGIKRAS
jgi:hypothetical protein